MWHLSDRLPLPGKESRRTCSVTDNRHLMKHKYQTQYCACREFRFQHFVGLALDENFKKSKYRQRAQQLPFSLLIFSALWEGGGAVNQEIPGDILVPDSTWPPNQQNWNQNFFSTPFDFHQKVARREFSSTEWEVSLTQKTRNVAVFRSFHCHQYHFNQINSLLYS